MEIYQSKDGSELAVKAATWELSRSITFESLHEEFRKNPAAAWRNYGSVVTFNVEAALKDQQAVLRNVNAARNHPWDVARSCFFEWFRGRAGVRYFFHIDLSKNRDATGLALTHREREGSLTKSVVDFMLRVEAGGRDINFADIRSKFIYTLTARGFHIQVVSFDTYNSAEMEQILKEKGYETAIVSVDRSTDPYDTLIELLLDTTPEHRRLDYYNYPTFIREMEELRLVNGLKYDHPKKSRTGDPGSKDVADGVAGSVYSSIQYELDNPIFQAGAIRVIPGRGAFRATYGERSRF